MGSLGFWVWGQFQQQLAALSSALQTNQLNLRQVGLTAEVGKGGGGEGVFEGGGGRGVGLTTKAGSRDARRRGGRREGGRRGGEGGREGEDGGRERMEGGRERGEGDRTGKGAGKDNTVQLGRGEEKGVFRVRGGVGKGLGTEELEDGEEKGGELLAPCLICKRRKGGKGTMDRRQAPWKQLQALPYAGQFGLTAQEHKGDGGQIYSLG